MTDETERIAIALRTIAWASLLVVLGGALGNCEARAEDSQPREGQGEKIWNQETSSSGPGGHSSNCSRCPTGPGIGTDLGSSGSQSGGCGSAGASTSSTCLWLARALVAEAGWTATRVEYVALAWVLAKRWRAKKTPPPGYGGEGASTEFPRPGATIALGPGFVDVIRSYCAGLGRHAHKPRQRWLRELPADGQTRPEHWPDNARWERHAPRWRRVLKLVDEWAAGEHPDPCPRAVHFGGDMDQPRGRMRAVCGRQGFRNAFYEVSE